LYEFERIFFNKEYVFENKLVMYNCCIDMHN